MTVYEAVVLRLAMLGYEVTDNDKTGLEYLINLDFHFHHRYNPP